MERVKSTKREETEVRRERGAGEKKKRVGLGIFLFGISVLIAGIVTMVISLTGKPAVRDAEYLVSAGSFVREGADGVIWDFTEVGKGTLTTNNHANDYEFLWAIEGEKLKIETDWLYDLNDEFSYRVDQEAGTLTLTSGEGEGATEIVFRAVPDTEPEVEEVETEEVEVTE